MSDATPYTTLDELDAFLEANKGALPKWSETPILGPAPSSPPSPPQGAPPND